MWRWKLKLFFKFCEFTEKSFEFRKYLEKVANLQKSAQPDSEQFRPENPRELTGKMFQNSGFITSHLRILWNFLRCEVMNPEFWNIFPVSSRGFRSGLFRVRLGGEFTIKSNKPFVDLADPSDLCNLLELDRSLTLLLDPLLTDPFPSLFTTSFSFSLWTIFVLLGLLGASLEEFGKSSDELAFDSRRILSRLQTRWTRLVSLPLARRRTEEDFDEDPADSWPLTRDFLFKLEAADVDFDDGFVWGRLSIDDWEEAGGLERDWLEEFWKLWVRIQRPVTGPDNQFFRLLGIYFINVE
jgi:hypothetical protein